MRTQISAINQQILNEMYDGGMDSKGKGCEHLHQEAVDKTGLALQVIKDWIGNKRKTVSGRKYDYHKSHYTKGITAYNCFVREKKDSFEGISDWAPAWNNLTAEEKSSYKEKAKENTVSDKPKAAKALLKKIAHQVSEIGLYGVDLAVIGINKNDGSQVFFGENKTGIFFDSRPKIMEELFSFHTFANESKEVKIELKELRKKAQLHMNDLYSKAVGKNVPFPYKKVLEGQIIVNGLHEDLLPLRTVSCYGEKNLELILSVESITVDIPSHDYVMAGIEIDSEERIHSYGTHDHTSSDELENEADISILQELIMGSENDIHPEVTHRKTHSAVRHTITHPGVTHTNTHHAVTHTNTQPTVTHTNTQPTVTHTIKHQAVTHRNTHPAVIHTNTHPAVTHTNTHPAVTHTITQPAVSHTNTHPAVTHKITHPAVTHTITQPAVTHTNTHPAVTHTNTHPAVVHTNTVTNTITYPAITHTITQPAVTCRNTQPAVTQTITKPALAHKITHPEVTHRKTHSVTHTITHPAVTHTNTHPAVTHTNIQPAVTHTITQPLLAHKTPLEVAHRKTHSAVTHTIPQPAVTQTIVHTEDPHTITQPAVSYIPTQSALKKTKRTVKNKTTQEAVTHSTTSSETKARNKTTVKRKYTKNVAGKKKIKTDYEIEEIVDTRVQEDGRYYLVHWKGYEHSEDTWEPELNLPVIMIGQYFSKKFSKT